MSTLTTTICSPVAARLRYKNEGFYQLISTQDTLENTDDAVVIPDLVNVVAFETQSIPDPSDPSATITVDVRVNRVELTFAG